MALVREPGRLLQPLVAALNAAGTGIRSCSRCGSFTPVGRDPCEICANADREPVLCVVEEPSDILAIEASGVFRGRYHALGGKLSPAHHLGPEKLRLGELRERIAAEGIVEVMLALSTDMDGDATAGYVTELLGPTGVKVTRLAFGLPADSGVAYSDSLTLRRAIVHRIAQ